ncbi:MAG TPA: rod shape-determining protein MreC [Chloroflexota bacterium]|jgi:rod shape-determining protein MreC|nr:rod shape-determining protein MreC [Chloroflexota bacterium]
MLVALVLFAASRVPALGVVNGLALDVLSPIEELLTGSFRGAVETARTVTAVEDIVAENQALRAEVEQLQRDAVRAPELEREVIELRELLGLRREGAEWQWLDARVIGFDASNLLRSAVINRGERDGLVDGMTVMTSRGLVGRIVLLSSRWARVLLISDASSTANAVVQRTRARGVVYGQRGATGKPSLVMRYVPQGEEMNVGDQVITSGVGGIFPAGIAVGTIRQVQRRETDMFQEATVEPSADLLRLEKVYVITNHVPVKLD